MSKFTEWVRWGNGGEDPKKEGYYRSILKGLMTAQQFGAFLGLNQGAARDVMSGRHTGVPRGKKIAGVWFIPYAEAVDEARRRGLFDDDG